MANNQLLASDNFASGSLAPGWSASYSFAAVQVSSPGVTEAPAANTTGAILWSGRTWPTDQTSEITSNFDGADNGIFPSLIVRGQGDNTRSGYEVQFAGPGTAGLYSFASGVPTLLLQTTGLTFTSGDIWTLQAQGATLSLYQNFTKVLAAFDTTYTSGLPGYLLYSQTTLSHCQVFSWRGYNGIQQDGIWQKQGCIIAPTATDLSFSTFPGIHDPSRVLFEGNAQILSGTVYKMWASAGSGISYHESHDCKTWSRYASLVIAGQAIPQVFEHSGTKYLYTQPSNATGTGSFSVYTGTDGITWTLQSADIGINLGTAGQWDAFNIWYFSPVYIDSGGTWWATYLGDTDSNYLSKVGLATSSDGISWTKHAGNPVVTNFIARAPVLLNNLWYAWGESNQPGLGASHAKLLDPSDTVRMHSPDLITWSGLANSIHHMQGSEGVNYVQGQAYADSVLNVGGKAYLIYDSTPADGEGVGWQINLAIAPASLATISAQPENAFGPVAAGDFSGGNGPLPSTLWTTPTGAAALQIASHLLEPTTTGANDVAVYTGAAFEANQSSTITLATLAASSFASPIVRASTSALTWYEVQVGGPTGSAFTTCQIFRRVAGTATAIGPQVQITPSVADNLTLQVITGNDNFPLLSLFQNDFMVVQVQDQSASPITTGNPGVLLNAASAVTHAQISGWAGGNAEVIPDYQSGSGAANFILLGCGSA